MFNLSCLFILLSLCFYRPCGCGAGDSGCIECGCCRSCARENDQDVDVAAAWGQLVAGGLVDNKQTDIIVFDVRCGTFTFPVKDFYFVIFCC